MKSIIWLVLYATITSFCGKKTDFAPDDKTVLKILFVGNSLTYTNDIPRLVHEIGQHDNVSIEYKSITAANYSLDDHLAEGKVQQEIKNTRFDFVVVQQGPSALPESQKLLLASATAYKKICDDRGAKLALYTVWPSRARFFDLDNVIFSYSNAAKLTSSIVCPAGLAWKHAWASDKDLALYSPDEFHPSLTGSVLAALTIYGKLTGKKDFAFLIRDKASWKKEISVATLNKLTAAALKAVAE